MPLGTVIAIVAIVAVVTILVFLVLWSRCCLEQKNPLAQGNHKMGKSYLHINILHYFFHLCIWHNLGQTDPACLKIDEAYLTQIVQSMQV